MSVPPPATEAELHAFVDDELEASRRGEILLLLADDPILAKRVAGYGADRDRLRAAVAPIAERPVPDAWVRQIEAATTRRIEAATTRRFPQAAVTRRYAIAAGIALMAGAGALTVREWPRGDTILADAEAARSGLIRGSSVTPEQLASAPLRDGVLQAVLGMKVHVPDLARDGFRLARLELFGHAAQLRYADARHRLLTIYVRRSNGDVRFDLLRHGPTRICVWQDNVVGAVIIAPMSAGEMMRVASSAYGDLNL